MNTKNTEFVLQKLDRPNFKFFLAQIYISWTRFNYCFKRFKDSICSYN